MKTIGRAMRSALLLLVIALPESCAGHWSAAMYPRFAATDYSRNDLLDIAGVGCDGTTTCAWKIAPEMLASQKAMSLDELVASMDFGRLIAAAIRFTNDYYDGMWRGKLHFVSMEYETVNDAAFGASTAQRRNDWIIMVNFRDTAGDTNQINETVFMLPDGRIVLSSNVSAQLRAF